MTKSGRNEEKTEGEEKHLIGVLDETGQPVQGKPCVVVEKQSEWSSNHPFDPERLQPPPPVATNVSFLTCYLLLGVLGRLEQPGQGKQGESMENHLLDPGPPHLCR